MDSNQVNEATTIHYTANKILNVFQTVLHVRYLVRDRLNQDMVRMAYVSSIGSSIDKEAEVILLLLLLEPFRQYRKEVRLVVFELKSHIAFSLPVCLANLLLVEYLGVESLGEVDCGLI